MLLDYKTLDACSLLIIATRRKIYLNKEISGIPGIVPSDRQSPGNQQFIKTIFP
jgi:hypothetical protein